VSAGVARLHRVRTDGALLRRFRSGDESAFAALHARYAADIRSYAAYMLRGSAHDPDDAAQDVFLRAYQALRRDEREIDVRPWLFRVAHNRCIDALRRPVGAQLTDDAHAPVAGDPAVAIEQRETMRALLRDIGGLTDGQRSALLLRELGGLSHVAVGEALGISEMSSRMLVRRARLALTEAAEARDTACDDVRMSLAAAADAGRRASRRERRHLAGCTDCAAWRAAHARVERELSLLLPAGLGMGALLKAFGGGGAAAGGGGAIAATSTTGLVSTTAAKLTVGACCALLGAGTAVGLHEATDDGGSRHTAAPERAAAPRRAAASARPAARPTGLATRSVATTAGGATTTTRTAPARTVSTTPPAAQPPARGVAATTVDLSTIDRAATPTRRRAAPAGDPIGPTATIDLAGFDGP
jgi:RNA polymerase sigma factor (sigma-70 family)